MSRNLLITKAFAIRNFFCYTARQFAVELLAKTNINVNFSLLTKFLVPRILFLYSSTRKYFITCLKKQDYLHRRENGEQRYKRYFLRLHVNSFSQTIVTPFSSIKLPSCIVLQRNPAKGEPFLPRSRRRFLPWPNWTTDTLNRGRKKWTTRRRCRRCFFLRTDSLHAA